MGLAHPNYHIYHRRELGIVYYLIADIINERPFHASSSNTTPV
jgi:hypothetical protein